MSKGEKCEKSMWWFRENHNLERICCPKMCLDFIPEKPQNMHQGRMSYQSMASASRMCCTTTDGRNWCSKTKRKEPHLCGPLGCWETVSKSQSLNYLFHIMVYLFSHSLWDSCVSDMSSSTRATESPTCIKPVKNFTMDNTSFCSLVKLLHLFQNWKLDRKLVALTSCQVCYMWQIVFTFKMRTKRRQKRCPLVGSLAVLVSLGHCMNVRK